MMVTRNNMVEGAGVVKKYVEKLGLKSKEAASKR
jgi:hypothetical protein